MSLKPLNDRVLIHKAKTPEHFTSSDGISASKIIIPDSVKGKHQPNVGIVLDMGDEAKKKDPDLKKGDTILYEKYSGADVQLVNANGVLMKDLLMIKYEDIVSKYEDDGYFYDDLLKPLRDAEQKEKEEQEKLIAALVKAQAEPGTIVPAYEMQCWNRECQAKLKIVMRQSPTDQVCEYCGSTLSQKQSGPQVNVKGGTPKFHVHS